MGETGKMFSDMNKFILGSTACIAVWAAGAAEGGSATIGINEGPVIQIEAGTLQTKLTDNGRIKGAALQSIHREVHNNGQSTDGQITFFLANTNRGLSFFTLIDDNTAVFRNGTSEFDSAVRVTSSANSTANVLLNDRNETKDITAFNQDFNETFATSINGRQTVGGVATWKGNSRGDALIWTRLRSGDHVTFDIAELRSVFSSFAGLDQQDTFKFLNWTGSEWESIYTGGFDDGLFSFGFQVATAPTPTAALLGIGGLLCTSHRRRRR